MEAFTQSIHAVDNLSGHFECRAEGSTPHRQWLVTVCTFLTAKTILTIRDSDALSASTVAAKATSPNQTVSGELMVSKPGTRACWSTTESCTSSPTPDDSTRTTVSQEKPFGTTRWAQSGRVRRSGPTASCT